MKDLAVSILLCSSEDKKDRPMVKRLKAHLSPLVFEKRIALWDHSNIIPGADREKEMDKHLEEAQIILLLISSGFLASPYWYSVMQRAMERYERKGVRVINVILRDCMWEKTLLNKLRPLPDDGASISEWANRGVDGEDKAYKNVAEGIFEVVEELKAFSLSNERRTLEANLDQLIDAVMFQIQPPVRAAALKYTLQQLKMIVPNDVTLADMALGWRTLSYTSKQGEGIAIEKRRKTCEELADLASLFTVGQGDLTRAIKTWRIWRDAFQNSDDDRQNIMAQTLTRELKELKKAAATH